MFRFLISLVAWAIALAVPQPGLAQSNPIPWADVFVRPMPSGKPMVIATTDARGMFRGLMNLPSGDYEIGVRCAASDTCGRSRFETTRINVTDAASGGSQIADLNVPAVRTIDLDTRANGAMGQMSIVGLVVSEQGDTPTRYRIYVPPWHGNGGLPGTAKITTTGTPGGTAALNPGVNTSGKTGGQPKPSQAPLTTAAPETGGEGGGP